MRIIEDKKLDFSDVLLVPKRSTLISRMEVDLYKTYKLRNHSYSYKGIPIIAANMDGVGTISMAWKLAQHGLMTTLSKHHSDADLIEIFCSAQDGDLDEDCVAYSMGITDEDVSKLDRVLDKVGFIKHICIDVANGYSENFLYTVSKLASKYRGSSIMAGNVATPEVVEQLILNGVNSVKVGIGPGCFTKDTEILTTSGLKRIVDIEIGDLVLTHKGRVRKVVNRFTYTDKPTLIRINGIECTLNHEFYVVLKSDIDKLTDDNIEKYARWIPAEELSKEEHLLIKLR